MHLFGHATNSSTVLLHCFVRRCKTAFGIFFCEKKYAASKNMWREVFPEYAVKQALHEVHLERGDEHIITAMQSDLVTRCTVSLLKGALLHCTHKKRKFISEIDIDKGRVLSVFRYKSPPSSAGPLLDGRVFTQFVTEHIKLVVNHIEKGAGDAVEREYKISQETLAKLQSGVEGGIRGFVDELKQISEGVVGFRQFEVAMGNVLQDPTYVSHDQIFSS